MSKWPASLILCWLLGFLFFGGILVLYLNANDEAAQRRKAHDGVMRALAYARLPEPPKSAKILNESSEATGVGEMNILSFNAPLKDIQEWIGQGKRFVRETELESKARKESDIVVHRMKRDGIEGDDSQASVTIHEHAGRVDVEIFFGKYRNRTN